MNFMILSEDPVECAYFHPDKHINSQIKEAVQMMVIPHWMKAKDQPAYKLNLPVDFPKPTHEKHPCSVWVRYSQQNYEWAMALLNALCKEKRRRFIFPHEYECWRDWLAENMYYLKFKQVDRTPFAQAMPEQYYKYGKAVEAYREYFNFEKRHLCKWYGNQIPYWFKKDEEIQAILATSQATQAEQAEEETL